MEQMAESGKGLTSFNFSGRFFPRSTVCHTAGGFWITPSHQGPTHQGNPKQKGKLLKRNKKRYSSPFTLLHFITEIGVGAVDNIDRFQRAKAKSKAKNKRTSAKRDTVKIAGSHPVIDLPRIGSKKRPRHKPKPVGPTCTANLTHTGPN